MHDRRGRVTMPGRRVSMACAAVALAAASTAACGGGGGSPSREDVLGALAEDVMEPTYRVIADRAAALAVDVRDACDDRTDDDALERARGAWSLLRGSWMEARAFRFGPVSDDPTMATFDLPVDRTGVDRVLAGSNLLHEEAVGALPADQRNLSAVEYALHHDEPLSRRTCDYLEPATTLLANGALRVLMDWVEGRDGARPFVEQLAHPGEGGMYATVDEALDDIVNGMIAALDEVAADRTGMVSGDTTGNVSLKTADPGLAQRGRRDAIDTVVGVQRLYRGGADGGIRDLARSVSKPMARRLSRELDDAIDAIKELPQPLALATQRAPAHEAYVAVRTAQATLQNEIAGQLGVTVRPLRTG